MGWETENTNTKNTEDTDILCEKGKAEHSCMFTERQKDIVNGNWGQIISKRPTAGRNPASMIWVISTKRSLSSPLSPMESRVS